VATLASEPRTDTDTDTRTLWFGESLAEIRVSTRDGEGGMSMIEMDTPFGHMTPLHVHDEDESFYVLDGHMTLFVGDRVVEARAGSTVTAPKGIPHTFRVDSAQGVRALVMTSPGRFEDFVRAVSRPAALPERPVATEPPTIEQIEAFTRGAIENGIEILGPPGMLPTDL
jgi:quercetin dioxygenase-like cupin family protein